MTLTGCYTPRTSGDRTTPGEAGFVDVDSLCLSGGPIQLAEWIGDRAMGFWMLEAKRDWLEALAERLCDHHEKFGKQDAEGGE